MSENTNIKWRASSDKAILKTIGEYVKHHRLEQNKTQQQLADEAGINRSTLSEFEKGIPSSMITFIQLLRALKQLQILEQFQIELLPSPIQLAEMQMNMRQRASKSKLKVKKQKPEW